MRTEEDIALFNKNIEATLDKYFPEERAKFKAHRKAQLISKLEYHRGMVEKLEKRYKNDFGEEDGLI